MKNCRRQRNRFNGAVMVESLEARELLSAVVAGMSKLPVLTEEAVGGRRHQRQVRTAPATLENTAPAQETVNMKEAGTLAADLNADGNVDLGDFDIWMASVGTGTRGDINHDGNVDLGDFDLWLENVGRVEVVVPPTSYDWHTETINGVVNIWAPNPYDFGTTFSVTDKNALFGADGVPSITSIYQGGTADCYYLAAIGSVANSHPEKIQALVKNDTNGGWTVQFSYFNPATGRTAPVVVHTSSDLSSTWQTIVNGEVWSEVMEKAYAAFRTWNGSTSTNTMYSIGWGYAGTALQHLGVAYTTASYTSNANTAFTALVNNLAAGKAVDFHTSATATGMVASHVYIMTGTRTDETGTKFVTTYNPWGFYEERSFSNLIANGVGYFVVGTVT